MVGPRSAQETEGIKPQRAGGGSSPDLVTGAGNRYVLARLARDYIPNLSDEGGYKTRHVQAVVLTNNNLDISRYPILFQEMISTVSHMLVNRLRCWVTMIPKGCAGRDANDRCG